MKTKHWLYGILAIAIIAVIFISGCTQKETKFVCPDGTVVSDESLCPKEEKTEIKTEPKIVQEKVVIYEDSGEIQKAITSGVLKEMTTPEGGTYRSNLYQGGEIEMIISASSSLNYVLMAGQNCVTEGVGTTILKKGNIKYGIVTWKPSEEKVSELCIKLENPNFIDWDNINPVAYQITIKETQLREE